MKDFLSRFSFGDVVAYLLPGFTTLSAFLAIAMFTPLQRLLDRAPRDVTFIHAVAFACVSYVFGALISGSSAALVPWLFIATRWRRFVEPRDGICPHELGPITKTAFARV